MMHGPINIRYMALGIEGDSLNYVITRIFIVHNIILFYYLILSSTFKRVIPLWLRR